MQIFYLLFVWYVVDWLTADETWFFAQYYLHEIFGFTLCNTVESNPKNLKH